MRTTPRTDAVPSHLVRAEQLYRQHCQSCHGERGAGTQSGPTFLSPIYAPNHHADQAFLLAPQQGVQAHHWNFGPMPPVPGLSDEDRRAIVRYVRWFQGLE